MICNAINLWLLIYLLSNFYFWKFKNKLYLFEVFIILISVYFDFETLCLHTNNSQLQFSALLTDGQVSSAIAIITLNRNIKRSKIVNKIVRFNYIRIIIVYRQAIMNQRMERTLLSKTTKKEFRNLYHLDYQIYVCKVQK